MAIVSNEIHLRRYDSVARKIDNFTRKCKEYNVIYNEKIPDEWPKQLTFHFGVIGMHCRLIYFLWKFAFSEATTLLRQMRCYSILFAHHLPSFQIQALSIESVIPIFGLKETPLHMKKWMFAFAHKMCYLSKSRIDFYNHLAWKVWNDKVQSNASAYIC